MEKRTGNWTPDRRTERAALRRDFENLTPGQRVEQAIILSRELTSLAARRAAGRPEDLIDLERLREAREGS